jgi:hypothetical protein
MNQMQKKLLQGILSCAGVLLLASSALAVGAGTGTVVDIVIESGTNHARINVAGVGGTRPGCHNIAYTNHFAFDISTAKGKALLAGATSAMLAGKTVGATGAGSCTTVTTGGLQIETLSSLVLLP